MNALMYMKPGLKVLDIPVPELVNDDDVRIRMSYASVCGSDLHIAAGFYDANTPAPFPMGHEGSGIVDALGSGAKAKGLKIGDKVTFYFNNYCGKCHYCRNAKEQFCENIRMTVGAMAEYMVVGEQQVYKLPDDIDMKTAALIEPISVCMRGIDLCGIRPGDKVAVSGGGGIGQIAMQLAKLSGAAGLTMIEPVAEKRDIALECGADHVIDPAAEDTVARALEITGGYKFDKVIECSGAAAAVKTAYDITGRGGTVVYLATYAPGVTLGNVEMAMAFMEEITVITGVCQSPYVLERSIDVYKNLTLKPLVKRTYSLSGHDEAFADQRTGKSLKSVFKID